MLNKGSPKVCVKAENYNMIIIESQWLFIVTDTDSSSFDMWPLIQLGHDGYNMAFLFNTSLVEEGLCEEGVQCVIEEL